MSDFSDSTKSQENPKDTGDKPTVTAQKNTTEAPFEQEETVDEVVPQDILSEKTPATADDSSEKVTDAQSSSSEYIEPPTSFEYENKFNNAEETLASKLMQGAALDGASDTVEDETTKNDTDDTDEEVVIAAAASKVSSRFGGTGVEAIRSKTESTNSATTLSHHTASAEVPPQPKEKKERKTKEPLPDVAPESRIFNTLALLPCLTLLVFAALQGGIALFFRDLWSLQETQTAAVVKDTLAAANWLTPMLDGKPYSAAMPLYFWFSSAVALIPDMAITFAVKVSTVLSSMLFVLSTYLFARAVGIGKKTSLTAGLLTMAAFLPAVTMQLNGLETLFAALVTFSHAAFVMGWKRQRSFFWITAGFICAAAATLTGGFPGLFLPLFSIMFISCWRKRPTRFGEWDVAGGFGIYLTIVFSWFAYVYFAVQPEYLLNLVPNILAAPFKGVLTHLPYWWHMLALLPFMLLPWLIVILVLPWTKVFSITFYKKALATRNPENIGVAYLWLSVLLTCALYCVLDFMTPVWLLVLLPQIAILAARAIKNFSPLRSKVFYRLLALIFLGAGAGLIGLVNFTTLIPFEIQGWMYLSAIMLAAAGILWIRFPLNSRAGVVGLTLITTLLMQPLFILSAPAINGLISTKDISITMEEYAEKDFEPVVYNADPAPFAYFVTAPVTHVFDLHSLTTILNSKKNVVLIMHATDWNNWLTKPESLKLVGTQPSIVPHLGQGFVLAVQEKKASRYIAPQSVEPQLESVPPETQQPVEEEPKVTPAPSKPAIETPQTDNEEEPAPLQEPINDNSTTATSPDSKVKQEAAMVIPTTPELVVPKN